MTVALNDGGESGAMAKPAGSAMDDETTLVAAAQHGDSAALEKLLARYEGRIFRLALNITRNREDAEEVTQDAFLRAFSRLDTFRGESRFSTWLTRIAVNHALMKLRKRRPNVTPLDDLVQTDDGSLPREIVDWGPNPEQRYAQQELREILDKVIAMLNPAHRLVFQLRDVEEFSIHETAEALGLSIPAVKSRLMRARLELREGLSKYFSVRERRPVVNLQAQPQLAG